MKVSVSYKFTWIPENMVRRNLQMIKDWLDYLWIENFILTLDMPQHPIEPHALMDTMMVQIKEVDFAIALINHQNYSEGMLLELGIARWMGKKIVLFVQKEFEKNIFLSYGIADDVIFFENTEDLKDVIIEYFGLVIQRQIIDNVDNQLLDYLKQRFDAVNRVWKYKKYFQKSALDQKRWDEVLAKKVEKAEKLGLNSDVVRKIWNDIHDEAINMEENI